MLLFYLTLTACYSVNAFTPRPVSISSQIHSSAPTATSSITSLQLGKSDEDNEVPTSNTNPADRRTFFKVTTKSAVAAATAGIATTSGGVTANANVMTGGAGGIVSNSSVQSSTPSILSSSTATANVSAGGITLPPMGLGAWSWGDTLFWGYDPKQDADLRQVFDYAVSKKLAFFDTAELYGLGRSETLLGNFRNELTGGGGSDVQIATKFAAFPFRTKPKDVVNACKASLKRLNPTGSSGEPIPIDLYQIHFPNAWSNEAYWDGLAQCYEQGLVKSVGVSNYGVDALRATHAKLAERGIPLATNQIQLSLLYRFPLENGLLDTCNELGVKVLSYSPLALGFLTGKYDKDHYPSGPRANVAKELFENDTNDSFTGLLNVMKAISSNHNDAPLSQVAINWTRAKGTIPIPGARSLKQATQNLGALDWDLTEEEVKMIDLAAATVPAYISPDKSPFPKEDINTKLKMFDS